MSASFLLAATLAGTGCIGNIGGNDEGSLLGPGMPGGPGGPGGPVDVASSGLRRMTPAQYQNTLRDLLGDPGLVLDLDADEGDIITQLAVDKLRGAAAAVVGRRESWTVQPFPCDTSGADDAQCVEDFIRTFGRRAFRHTLADDEVQRLQTVFTTARATQSFDGSLLVVLETMLQSPDVYYFLELGRDPSGTGIASGVRPLTGWERATRLSYFLWNTLPDDELLDAAEAGDLDTVDGMRTQAERLATNDRGRDTFKGFFSDWLELDGTKKHASLVTANKDAELYPADSPELREAMRIETEALVERVVFDGDGRFETLLTTNEAYVNGPLAALYGVDGPSGDTFEWVKLPSDERAGLLTRAAFLTVFAGVEVKSPIRRGAHILHEVMCIELGPPPPNASDVPVKGGSVDEDGNVVNKTIREDVVAKTSNGVCNNCHSIINPVGFTFEHYDALGQWIDNEEGEGADGAYSLPIDASGGLPGADGDSAAVDGAVEISAALGKSAEAQSCLSKRFFQSALRRVPIDADLASVDGATEVTQSGGTLTDLVVALATSNAFLHARLPEDDQ